MANNATLHIRTLAAAVLFAESAKAKMARPHLQGVNVTTDRHHTTYVATDGSALIAIRRTAVNDLIGSWTIPSDKITVLKAPTRGSDEAELSIMTDGWLQITTPDGSRVPFRPIDTPAMFPNWRMVVPHSPSNEPAAFNPDYFVRLRKAAKLADLGELVHTYNGLGGPSVVTFSDYADAFGLVMPLRNAYTAEPTIPDWAKS